ncbi:MAG: hypothetical protein D6806_00685 [Deltaproteobacteria bacterium]|nr:MAG: hypothetical protein D6806_00685 [Deltaproteobacteria bacterium]
MSKDAAGVVKWFVFKMLPSGRYRLGLGVVRTARGARAGAESGAFMKFDERWLRLVELFSSE